MTRRASIHVHGERTVSGWNEGGTMVTRLGVLVCALMTLLVLPSTAAGQAQEAVEYYALDHLGSVRVIFDSIGTVIGRGDYLPYGEEGPTSTGLPSERFTGQARDSEAALDYFNARMYQPRHGRFSTVDPLFAGALTSPQLWNRYNYVSNNPVMLSDPTGLYAKCEVEHGTTCYATTTAADRRDATVPIGGSEIGDSFWFHFYDPSGNYTWGYGSSRRSPDNAVSTPLTDSPPNVELSAAGLAPAAAAALVEPTPIGETVLLATMAVTAAVAIKNAIPTKTHVTYTLTNPAGKVYVGRASGYGSPQEVMMKRFTSHEKRALGFGNPQLDRSLPGYAGYQAIRGREQMLIDAHGGVGSPNVENSIRAVSRWNPARPIYYTAAFQAFGLP